MTGAAFLGYRLYSRSTDKVVVENLRTGEYLQYQVREASSSHCAFTERFPTARRLWGTVQATA